MVSSQCFVLNEWLLHDLRGDNGQEAQAESFRFLERLKEQCDRIAVLKGSKWMNKAYDLMRQADPLIRPVSKYLHQIILRDPQKCVILDPKEIKPVSEELESILQEDLYLFQIYYSTKAITLVTTDEKLIQTISTANINVSIRCRGEFLKEYLK